MRRDSANRHRANFLVQLGVHLADILAMVGQGADEAVAEAVANELRRMGDTAERLGLDGVARRARAAVDHRRQPSLFAALRAIARAASVGEDASPFGPIVAVVRPDQVEAFERAAQSTSERVLAFATSTAAGATLEIPAAALFPASDADAIRVWAAEGTPVIAWGEDAAWPVRVEAVSAGARAFLPGALDLEVVLDQARWIVWQRSEAPIAAILGDADSLASALSAQGIRVIPPTEPVDTWSPDGAVVAGRDPARLLRALRAHPGWARTAVLALSSGPVAGADEVLPLESTDEVVIGRLRAWLDRVRSVPVDRDPLTGLPNRPAALRAIDRWLAWGRRTNTPLSLGLVALDGLGDLRLGTSSLAAEAAVHRAAAAALTRAIRRLDVVGRVGPSLYIAGLPNCRVEEARKRLASCVEALKITLAADPRATGVLPALGVADSSTGAEGLLARAWENLALTRQGA